MVRLFPLSNYTHEQNIIYFIGLICCLIVQAQIKLETPSYLVYFTNQGEISYYINKQEVQPDTIYFRSGKNTGPRFEGVRLSLQKSNKKQVIFNGKKIISYTRLTTMTKKEYYA